MSQPMLTEHSELDPNLKNFACLNCRQRKIKCDRRTPCSHCVKAEKSCSFIAPVRGRRKRIKPSREGLHAKLKRYEQLLKSYGAKIEQFDDSDSETTSLPDAGFNEDTNARDESQPVTYEIEENKPKLITKDGTSSYFDSAPWSNMGDEPQHPETGGPSDPVDEPLNVDDSFLFFGPEPNQRIENLVDLHPSVQMLPKLREIYVDRVDPLTKILHLPTFWTALVNGLKHPQAMSKSLEAAMFAFCLVTICASDEEECQNIFRTQKSVMYSRYRLATRQALVNAGFLSTSSPMTLQAFSFFIMCVRNTYSCDTLFVLSGIAIRLALKMGLHRDGTSLGLSPFETEMRRRLWWHLVHVDFRVSDVLGAKPSLDLSSGDVKMPLNVEDDSLDPAMADFPPERSGITTSSFCLMRCEFMEALRNLLTAGPGQSHVRWEALYNPEVTLARKDNIITQLEDLLERKYLRYCDPSNTLHTFLSIFTRSGICKMRIFAHSPRQFADNSLKVPETERNIVFENATKLLKYINLMQEDHQGCGKFKWQASTSFLWNAILYVLIEMRYRKTGPEVDKSWRLIGEVFSYFPRVFEKSTTSVYTALGQWTLEVWDDYVAASKAEGLLQPSTPEYIDAIRRCRRPAIVSPSKTRGQAGEKGHFHQNSLSYDNTQAPEADGTSPDFQSYENFDFPSLMSYEMDANEWIQWEQLVAEQGEFGQVDGI